MKQERNPNILKELFIPDYDELALFSMSLSCFLLLVSNNPPSSWDLNGLFHGKDWFVSSLFVFLFVGGMFLCLFHAFSKRQKTLIEKKMMLIFAIFLSASSGIFDGIYILTLKAVWITPFPVLNIISGAILLIGLRADIITEKNIGDENASLSHVAVSTVIIGLVFFVCQYGFKLNWVITYSICIAWATTFNKTTNSLLLRASCKIKKAFSKPNILK